MIYPVDWTRQVFNYMDISVVKHEAFVKSPKSGKGNSCQRYFLSKMLPPSSSSLVIFSGISKPSSVKLKREAFREIFKFMILVKLVIARPEYQLVSSFYSRYLDVFFAWFCIKLLYRLKIFKTCSNQAVTDPNCYPVSNIIYKRITETA